MSKHIDDSGDPYDPASAAYIGDGPIDGAEIFATQLQLEAVLARLAALELWRPDVIDEIEMLHDALATAEGRLNTIEAGRQ